MRHLKRNNHRMIRVTHPEWQVTQQLERKTHHQQQVLGHPQEKNGHSEPVNCHLKQKSHHLEQVMFHLRPFPYIQTFFMRLLHWDAINPHSIPPGQPYKWGDPNLFFGADGKGYAREPGDADFVPYQPLSTNPVSPQSNPKKPKMKRNAYYPMATAKQVLWLTNFFNKLIGHAPTLGVSPVACAAAVAEARWIIYILTAWQPAQRQWSKSCTDAVKDALTGTSGVLMNLPIFTPPPLPAADAVNNLPSVVPVLTGALDRIFSLIQIIQEAPGYNETLGIDLGIVGSVNTGVDLTTVQPQLTAEIRNQQVFIGWGWGGLSAQLDMLQIQVDRADGKGYVDLAYDTTPNYIDTAAHPAALTKWKYRGIYRLEEAQVGLWSAEVSVVVGG